MYKIVEGSTHSLPDIEAHIETLNTLARHPVPEVRDLFDPHQDLIVTRAPGRLDVMGGIADYSGSLVLEMPLREATIVTLQRDAGRMLRIVSEGAEGNDRSQAFEISLDEFERDGRPIDYSAARAFFLRDPGQHWASYVAGAFLVLMRERSVAFPQGARILVRSDAPEGKGVSSSAALEIAAMQAIASAFGISIEPRDIALLCQRVENLVVGAPCGVMDQMTAVCGEEKRLLALLCQPAELQGEVVIPEEIAIWGIDSGVRHSVSGSDYNSVRVGAFMGYRIIAEKAGLTITITRPDQPVTVKDPEWNGYLANITPSRFEQHYSVGLPKKLKGDEFLSKYGGTTDSVTHVDPARLYAVRQPTAHPIYEHFRVRAFAELLGGPMNESRLRMLGELMYQSHASYSACGLGSSGTDRIVELSREVGSNRGVFGAKITGGGSGGTVTVLGRAGAGAAIDEIVESYTRETGHRPVVFRDSSVGAAGFGHIRLKNVSQ